MVGLARGGRAAEGPRAIESWIGYAHTRRYKIAGRKALAGPGVSPFKTEAFARFADREGREDDALCEAIRRARRGLIEAGLGGGIVKQRIARRGNVA